MKQEDVRVTITVQHVKTARVVNTVRNKEEHVVYALPQVKLKEQKHPKLKEDKLIILIALKKMLFL